MNRIVTPLAFGRAPDMVSGDDNVFRAMFERATDVVVITTADPKDPRITFVNDAFERLTGYGRDEVVGQSPKILQGPETNRAANDKIRKALKTESPVRVEILNYSKTGQKYWLDLSIFPIRDSAGAVTHYGAIERDITEQKAQENQLAQVEARLRAAMDGSPNAFYLLESHRDADGVIVDFSFLDINAVGERQIGMDREHVVGKLLCDLVPMTRRSGFFDKYRRVVETGVLLDEEIEAELGDGNVAWIRNQVVKVGDGVAITSHDITDRKKTELEIVRVEMRLRGAISGINDAFVLYDANDRLVTCNQQYIDTYPYLADLLPLEGRTFEEIVRAGLEVGAYTDPLALVNPDAWLAERLAKHRNPPKEPFEQRGQDGRWIRISERRTADGGIAGTRSDVTALKQAEARLLDAVNSIGEAFALFDEEDRLILFNQHYLDFWNEISDAVKPGITFRQLIEMSWDAGLVIGDGLERESWIEDRLRQHKAGYGFIERTLPGGRCFHITERRTADGGIVTIASDVSELKRTQRMMELNEHALRRNIQDLESTRALLQEKTQTLAELANRHAEQSRRAEEASRAKSQFLAMMSHELRTPLNAILGFSDMIREDAARYEGTEDMIAFAQDIHDSGEHLLSLINDILDMSKVEAGKYELHIEPVDTRAAVDYAVRLMRGASEESGLTLSVEVPDDLPPIEADERALRQVLLNLLSNAVKFTGQHGSITVSAEVESDFLRILVSDTGIGIPADAMERIAKPFEQVDNELSRQHKGTGLGLALSRALVELHGGRLDIASTLGEGTTVSFELPWLQDAAPPETAFVRA